VATTASAIAVAHQTAELRVLKVAVMRRVSKATALITRRAATLAISRRAETVVGSSRAAMQAGLKTAAQRLAAITVLTAVATAARHRAVLVTAARPVRAHAPRVSQAHRATTVVGTALPLTVARVSAQRCVANSRLAAPLAHQHGRLHAAARADRLGTSKSRTVVRLFFGLATANCLNEWLPRGTSVRWQQGRQRMLLRWASSTKSAE
jgi:hypothetical protein